MVVFNQSSSMGISNLPTEFRRFTLNSVQLRRLYSETLKALDDISGSGVIPSGTFLESFFNKNSFIYLHITHLF